MINPDASQRSYFTGNDSQPLFVAIGDGTFNNESMFLILLWHYPISIVLNDMNNDDNVDIIIAMQNTMGIAVFFWSWKWIIY